MAAWAVVLALLLTHRVFVTHDSLSNYAHVWSVAHRLWHGHGLPIRIPLAHGEAFAFPYAFFPWMAAVLLWPALGEWGVTLCIAVGFVGLAVAMLWAFPELGRGWWAAAALVNPSLVFAPIAGQLPFLWAMGLGFAAIGCWRRERYGTAAVLAACAQATHVVVMFPMLAVLVLARLRWEPNRRRLLGWYACSAIVVLPAAVLVTSSPVFESTSLATKLYNFADTVLPRAVVLVVPIAILGLQRLQLRRPRPALRWLPAGGFVVALVLNPVMTPAFDTNYAWGALRRSPYQAVRAYTRSKDFVPNITYRVLDGKVSMYEVLKAGGKLDSEFFPESFDRRSFGSVEAYSTFLRHRQVDAVVVFDSYDRNFRTDEHRLLASLARRGSAGCRSRTVGATRTFRHGNFDVYTITRRC